jgi:protein TonB
MSSYAVSTLQLPWAPSDSDKLFKNILLAFLLAFFCVALPVSYVALPELTRAEKEALPPQLARVVLEQKIIPPQTVTPPKVEAEQVVEKPLEKIDEKKDVAKTPPEKNPVNRDPQAASRDDVTAKARAVAQKSGLLAVANELNDLQSTDSIVNNVRAETTAAVSTNAATHQVSAVVASTNQQGRVIEQDEIVGQLQSTDLQARDTKATTAATEKAAASDNGAGQGDGRRGSSDVGLVFNKNKAGLHSLYERERRKDSSLKGKIVFQLTIEPSGKVSSVRILSSELNNPELEARIIARIKMFIFAPAAGNPVVVNYPVEFIPS